MAIIFSSVIGGVLGLFVYVRMNVPKSQMIMESARIDKKTGKFIPSVRVRKSKNRDVSFLATGVKSIGLSFIQMISLLTTYPIAWPAIFVSLFQIGGSVALLGKHVVDVKCLYPEYTEAFVFYVMHVAWAVVPILIVALCSMIWVCCYKPCKIKETKLKIKATTISVLYLLYPNLCTEALQLFACQNVCNQKSGFLSADLNEPCWEGRHVHFAFGIGVPMIILYVIGLPLLAFVAIMRTGQRAMRLGVTVHQMPEHTIYAMFYSMFDVNCWWWELTIAARKVAIASIGVFGAGLGLMQVHLTMALIVIIIVLTASVQPFGKGENNMKLHRLEMASLIATWMTLWAGSVFTTFPECKSAEFGELVELEWCVAMSLIVGFADFSCLALIAFLFLYYTFRSKKEQKKKAREKKEKKRRGLSAAFAKKQINATVAAKTLGMRWKKKSLKNVLVDNGNPLLEKKPLAAKSASSNASGGSTLPSVAPVIEHEHVHHHHHHHHYHKEGEDSGSESTDGSSSEREDDDDNNNDTSGVIEVRAMEVELVSR
jgi:hypothetical protein